MNILQLCKKVPLPPKDGEGVAVLSMAHGYNALLCNVDLLAFNTTKHHSNLSQSLKDGSPYRSIETIELDNSINYFKAFINIFQSESYNISRFILSHFTNKLIEILKTKRYDCVQLESLYMAPYIPVIKKYSNAVVVLRSHNREDQIWSDMAKNSSNPILKWYYMLCANRLSSYQITTAKDYHLLLAISESDYNFFKSHNIYNDVKLVPVGIDASQYRTTQNAKKGKIKIGYIGSLDWLPNIEGLSWFFTNVWPSVTNQNQNIEFHLAGRNAHKEISGIKASNFLFHGEVKDATEFLASLDIVVVPLFSGSGIRIKILESMAMGKAVISSSKGFEGINIQHKTHGYIANNAEEFISLILELCNNFDIIPLIGENARKFIEKNFDHKAIAQRAFDEIDYLIKLKRTHEI